MIHATTRKRFLDGGKLFFLLPSIALMTTLGCDKKDPKDEAKGPLPYGGVAITAVAPDFSSSKLYVQPLTDGLPTGELRNILSGESGDPWTVTQGDRLFFFNRTTTSTNFRSLDLRLMDAANAPQTRTEKAGIGDPHDALLLGGDRLLLAHYSAGKLIVINPADGSIRQEITADFDIGSDPKAVFRPEAFYRVSGAEGGEIYVLHQGRNKDFSGFTGSQQLFILKDDGQSLTALDLDPTKEKVQGIKLHTLNPQIIDGSVDPLKPMVAGLCTILDLFSPCTSGFEQVDLAARSSRMVYDITAAPEKGNGSVVAGKDGMFYAAVATYDRTLGFKTQIRAFDIKTQSSKTFYSISDANYAAYALGFDQTAGRIYVGEKKDDGSGQIAVLDSGVENGTPVHVLGVPLPPAKVTFLP